MRDPREPIEERQREAPVIADVFEVENPELASDRDPDLEGGPELLDDDDVYPGEVPDEFKR